MKFKFLLTCVAAVSVVFSVSYAINTYVASRYALTKGPKLICPSLVRIKAQEAGAIVAAALPLENRGTETVILDQFQTSCGCTTVEFKDGSRTVRAERVELGVGQKAELWVRIAVQGQIGSEMNVYVTARSNEPGSPQLATQFVVARVNGGIAARPTSVVFGAVPKNTEARRTVRVYDGGKQGRKVGQIVSSRPDRFTIRQLPVSDDMKPDPMLGTVIALVEVTANATETSVLDGDIIVQLDGEERLPDHIPVTGRVRDLVEVFPSSLTLPARTPQGTVWSGRCMCQSLPGRNLKIFLEQVPDGVSARVVSVKGNPSLSFVEVALDPRHISTPDQAKSIRLRAAADSETMDFQINVVCRSSGET